MPIINVEIMKTIDEREIQKTTKNKQRQKGARATEAIVKGGKLNDFVVHLSWNKKNFFNEIEYDKMYPSGSAPARIYGTPKMQIFL